MKLYLVRHAKAGEASDDASRPLTPKGELDALGLARLLKSRADVHPARIVHSSLLRARQSAVAVAQIIAPELTLEVDSTLAPEADPTPWVRSLNEEDHPDLMLVGHMPFMKALAYELLGSPVEFSTASCRILERDKEGHWNLLAYIKVQ